ncbi:hypothetical protein [Muricauda sp. MAR_2010_75]|uniref:hypothetical protein n=1 Tax=Allomuricauda sp. MAR_2010_75 TaxID=1250232 RepID=UPI000560DDC2|nr:hypothetical protein [Muricauda sp. MAR_2010_75]
MNKKKRHWLWNVLIVLTLIVCLLAFVAHYKNWYKVEEGEFKIFSGIYRQSIPIKDMDSILFVEKLPEMERSSGFSWLAKEKGVFKDSIHHTKIYVFVDDLRQQKIKLVHHDTLKIYFNMQDSLETQKIYAILQSKMQDNLETSK